jgi:membrane protein YdbS with pleckstrin-like domain
MDDMGDDAPAGRVGGRPMTGEAAAEGDLRLRPPAESLDPRVRRLWALQGLIATAAVAVLGGVAIVAWSLAGDPPTAALAGGLAGLVAIGVAASLIGARMAYRFLRFEVTPLGLYVQRGWLERSWTIVPHSRIQAVVTSSGPLERALGLATVEVRTASADAARVPGLDEDRIARLREDLAELAGEGEAT